MQLIKLTLLPSQWNLDTGAPRGIPLDGDGQAGPPGWHH